MKKLVLSLAVVFSLAMVSCGNNAEKQTETPETTTTEVVEGEAVETPDGEAAVAEGEATTTEGEAAPAEGEAAPAEGEAAPAAEASK